MSGFFILKTGTLAVLLNMNHSLSKTTGLDAKKTSVTDSQNKTEMVKLEKATFAGGCFWCMEADFEKIKGVKEVISGFTGGHIHSPSYSEVSKGKTGHVEAVQIIYNPKSVSYSKLLDIFWRKVDPTDEKGQFVDRGFQYTTAIFYHNEEQKKAALLSKEKLKKKGPFKKKIVTRIQPLKTFFQAEDYHQDYYKKNSLRYKFYRYRSGRNDFLKDTWKNFKSSPSPPQETSKKQNNKKKTTDQNKPLPTKSSPASKNKMPPSSLSQVKQSVKDHWKQFKTPSLEELKKQLSPLQYEVTQQDGTEKSFANTYWNNKNPGIYVDIVSKEPLFSSLDKYDSGTGWPSFTKPLVPANIKTKEDRKLFPMMRVEVRSQLANSHLGHIFQDGPPPTGLRYCINSAALRFIPLKDLKKAGYEEFLSLFSEKL